MSASIPSRADVVIIGGGLMGLCTAYALARQGREVLVIEERGGVGQGASFANGAMLTPSMANPWNAPGIWREVVRSLVGAGSAIDVRWAALPGAMRWGLGFLLAASHKGYARATAANFALSTYSTALTLDFAREQGFDLSSRGTMKLFADRQAFEAAKGIATELADKGLECTILDAAGVTAVEPRLAQATVPISGGLHFPGDAIGDAHAFCCRMREIVETSFAVRVVTDVAARRIITRNGKAYAVEMASGLIEARDIVVAAGLASPRLVGPLGVRLPIGPVKGYSETIDLPRGVTPLEIGLIDDVRHVGIVPLADRIRLVGTAEIAGHDLSISPAGIARLRASLAALMPGLAGQLDQAEARPWAGLRPVSSDGIPRIGAGGIPGLWINAGHSHLGWTEAMGSGAMLADVMLGRKPAIEPGVYHP